MGRIAETHDTALQEASVIKKGWHIGRTSILQTSTEIFAVGGSAHIDGVQGTALMKLPDACPGIRVRFSRSPSLKAERPTTPQCQIRSVNNEKQVRYSPAPWIATVATNRSDRWIGLDAMILQENCFSDASLNIRRACRLASSTAFSPISA